MENQLLECPHCKATYYETDSYCSLCGYPLKGDEKSIKDFKFKAFEHSLDKQENEKHVKNGTTTLFVIAGLFMLYGFVIYAMTKDVLELIFHSVFATIFIGLGFLSRKSTFAAVLIGVILYSMYVLLTIIGDPTNIVKGIIIKIFIFLYLGRALRGAMRLKKQSTTGTDNENTNI